MSKEKNIREFWKIKTDIHTYLVKTIFVWNKYLGTENKNHKIEVIKHENEKHEINLVFQNKKVNGYKKGRNEKGENGNYLSLSVVRQILDCLDFFDAIEEKSENNKLITFKMKSEFQINEENKVYKKLSDKIDKRIDEYIDYAKESQETNHFFYQSEESDDEDSELNNNKDSKEQNIKLSYSYLVAFDYFLYKDKKDEKFGLLFKESGIKENDLQYYLNVIRKIYTNDEYSRTTEKLKKVYDILDVRDLEWSTKKHPEEKMKTTKNSNENENLFDGELVKRVTFNELISSNDYYFIPIYQREYSWDKNAVNFCLDSIFYNFEIYKDEKVDEQKHFENYLNNIIFNKINNIYSILDGQQRIVTLSLLLISLIKAFSYCSSETNYDNDEFLLLNNHRSDDSNFFKKIHVFLTSNKKFQTMVDIFKGNVDDTEKNGNRIWENYQIISKFISDNFLYTKKYGELYQFANFLLEKSFFSVICLSYKPEAENRLFAGVNFGGKRIGVLDLIRNYIHSSINQKMRDNIVKLYNNHIVNKFKNKNDEDLNLIEQFLSFEMNNYNQSGTNLELNKNSKDNVQRNYKKFIHLFENVYKKYENNELIYYLFERILFFYYFRYGSIKKIKDIYNQEKNNSEQPKMDDKIKEIISNFEEFRKEIYFVNNQIETITHGGTKKVFDTLINFIFKYYFNDEKNQNKFLSAPEPFKELDHKKMKKVSVYLYELEKFSLFWTFGHFKGESLGNGLNDIAKKFWDKINENDVMEKEELWKELKQLVPEMRDLEDEKIKNNFYSYFPKIEIENKNKQKYLFVKKINYCLHNTDDKIETLKDLQDNIYYKKLKEEILTTFIDTENEFTYEHILAEKPKNYDSFDDDQKKRYSVIAQKIGNGGIESRANNSSKNNKANKNKKTNNNNNYTSEGKTFSNNKDYILNPLDNKDPKFADMNHKQKEEYLDSIEREVDKRSRQMMDILKNIF